MPFDFHLRIAGIVLAVSIGAFALLIGCVGNRDPGEAPKAIESEFSIVLTGNWQGHLGPCGCTEIQLGGLDRRTDKLKEIAPDTEARLLVDAGSLVEKSHRQSQLKLQTFLYGMKVLGYDAIGLTPKEIILLHETLAMDRTERPAIICSNMSEESRLTYSVEEYVTRSLIDGNQQLNCLVMAVADEMQLDQRTRAKVNLIDPVASIDSILKTNNIRPNQKSKDTLVIVMVTEGDETLTQRLQEIPAIDLLVRRGFFDVPEKVGSLRSRPLTITVGKMGKYLTHVTVPSSTADDPESYGFQSVEIQDTFELDPEITNLFDDYQMSMEMEKLVEEGMPRLALADPGNSFSGNRTCQQCHEDIYEQWVDTAHSHAMPTLMAPKVNRQFDPECVACHAVGMRYETGFRSMEATMDLANVGCEMCHGPGQQHIDDATENGTPKRPYRYVFSRCEGCHDHENSPRFDIERDHYFETIRHWKNEPRQYWK